MDGGRRRSAGGQLWGRAGSRDPPRHRHRQDIHLPAYAGADADGAMHGLEDGALEGEWKPREPERWTELGLNVAALYL